MEFFFVITYGINSAYSNLVGGKNLHIFNKPTCLRHI